MSKEHKVITNLQNKYPNQVKRFWLSVSEVFDYLSVADYGILFREQTVTNKVASPEKFAEYLSAGLKVLISEKLGDFSEFVEKNNCGIIIKNKENINLARVENSIKQINRELSEKIFTKQKALYEKIH